MSDNDLHVEQLPTGSSKRYGGVLVDTDGQVLLREVANHFGGYVWTFAKGEPNPGETPEQVALREVREETGIEAEITGEIPGWFIGDTSGTKFFMMTVAADHGDFHDETAQVCWVSWAEAPALIKQSTTSRGRARDLLVLAEASKVLEA